MIAGLLLAAGFGSRFGGEKLLADLHGKPLVRWSAEHLGGATDALFVVVPPDSAALRAALDGMDVRFVGNAARADGMSSSIRAGVAALTSDIDGILLALADEPFVDPAVALKVRDGFVVEECDAVVPMYRDRRGHPVLFGRSCFGALAALEGDEGARRVLENPLVRCKFVTVDSDAPDDIDDRATLERVAKPSGRLS